LASDISNIIKSEIASTVESLLSVTATVEEVVLVSGGEPIDQKCIKASSNFEFSGKSSTWDFYIPTATGAKFEYLMLGGATDLKTELDDEIEDAAKEIVSTISGSITTSVNAQGFDDVSGMKFTLGDSEVVDGSVTSSSSDVYKFVLKINDENIDLLIGFDSNILSNLSVITGKAPEDENSAIAGESQSKSMISQLLGEESVDNLKLLFDIKMRLSVRLGTKVCLLRDVISWDIGEIIELTQMISEPLDILVNGVVIGKGDPIIVEGKFGVKIKYIGTPKIN
jgi:flagellar motor switch protein FliN/FliY